MGVNRFVRKHIADPLLLPIFIEHFHVVHLIVNAFEPADLSFDFVSRDSVHEVDAETAVSLQHPPRFTCKPFQVPSIGESNSSTEYSVERQFAKWKIANVGHHYVNKVRQTCGSKLVSSSLKHFSRIVNG